MDDLALDELEKKVAALYEAEKRRFSAALKAYAAQTEKEEEAIAHVIEAVERDSTISYFNYDRLPEELALSRERFILSLELKKHAYWRSNGVLTKIYDKIEDGDELGKLIIEKAKHGDPWRNITQDYKYIFLEIVHKNSPIAHLVDDELRAKALNEVLLEVLAMFEHRNINANVKNEWLDILLSQYMDKVDFSYGPKKIKKLPQLDLSDCYVDNLYFDWWLKQQQFLKPDDAAKLLIPYLKSKFFIEEFWDYDAREIKKLLNIPEVKKYSGTIRFKKMVQDCLRTEVADEYKQNPAAIDELILMAEKPERAIEQAINDLAKASRGMKSLLKLRIPKELITAKALALIEKTLLKDAKQVYWGKTHLAGGLMDIYKAIQLGYFSEDIGRETIKKELNAYIFRKIRPAATVAKAALAYADKKLFGNEFTTILVTRAIADLVIRKSFENADKEIVKAEEAGIFSSTLFRWYCSGKKLASPKTPSALFEKYLRM
jgi:hypothetical protein